jgi:hypothetical protein
MPMSECSAIADETTAMISRRVMRGAYRLKRTHHRAGAVRNACPGLRSRTRRRPLIEKG